MGFAGFVAVTERDLLSGRASPFGLHWRDIPDAVIKLTTGERIAFEVEMSLKARDRYVDKIRYYVEHIREPNPYTPRLPKILYRCFKISIFRSLQSETRIYGSYFQIESADMGCF